MRLNGFGWFTVVVSLATSLVIAGCGSQGATKPAPVRAVHALNFAWGECPIKHHAERCSQPDPITGYFECDCVPDP
jgi:hypothetical protein